MKQAPSGQVIPSFATGMSDRLTRRDLLRTAAAASAAIALPKMTSAAIGRLEKPVRIGLIADLHHDVMHDGLARTAAFVKAMAARRPDAIMQLGDFAYPNASNKKVIDLFNGAHKPFASCHRQSRHGLRTHEETMPRHLGDAPSLPVSYTHLTLPTTPYV